MSMAKHPSKNSKKNTLSSLNKLGVNYIIILLHSNSQIQLTEAVTVPSNAIIVPNINEEDGFLLTCQMTYDNMIGWSKWSAV